MEITTEQYAEHARMSLDNYLTNHDIQHLKDAHLILTDAILQEYEKDKELNDKANNYS